MIHACPQNDPWYSLVAPKIIPNYSTTARHGGSGAKAEATDTWGRGLGRLGAPRWALWVPPPCPWPAPATTLQTMLGLECQRAEAPPAVVCFRNANPKPWEMSRKSAIQFPGASDETSKYFAPTLKTYVQFVNGFVFLHVLVVVVLFFPQQGGGGGGMRAHSVIL